MMKLLKTFILLITIILVVTTPVWACSVCFKDPNSQVTISLQKSVFVLLGFLLIVFCAFLKFIHSFARRSQAMQEQ